MLELLTAEGIQMPVRILGIPDALIEHGESKESVGIGQADIQAVVSELLGQVPSASPSTAKPAQ